MVDFPCLILAREPAVPVVRLADPPVDSRPGPPTTSLAARTRAAFCWAKSLGSSYWEWSHQTVAFCRLIKATYPAGAPADLDDVDRRREYEVDVDRTGAKPPPVPLVEVEAVALDNVLRLVCFC